MQIFNISWKWTVPNAMSLFRLVLVPVFAVLYLTGAEWWAFAALLLSGLTDVFDGMIARKLHQVTECGKLLDPLADKLTQMTVAVCLTVHFADSHPIILPMAAICLAKEICQGIGGVIVLRRGIVRSSEWFGKVSTVTFYACMCAIVLWHEQMADWVFVALIVAACVTMLVAFIGYLREFIHISREDTALPTGSEKG